MGASLKILAGLYKNYPLCAPKCPLKPTKAIVKEALFNILAQKVVQASFLDLFAGSGAVGFEALSRGASRLMFVDREYHCACAIRQSLGGLGTLCARVDVVQRDVHAAFSVPREPFDLVFVDPPYAFVEISCVLFALLHAAFVHEDSLVIVEESVQVPQKIDDSWLLEDQRVYGKTRLSFLKPSI